MPRVLIADDEASMRALVARAIAMDGHETVTAQEAGMTLEQFADFVYEASLIDWNALRERMQRILERLDETDEARLFLSERPDALARHVHQYREGEF